MFRPRPNTVTEAPQVSTDKVVDVVQDESFVSKIMADKCVLCMAALTTAPIFLREQDSWYGSNYNSQLNLQGNRGGLDHSSTHRHARFDVCTTPHARDARDSIQRSIVSMVSRVDGERAR